MDDGLAARTEAVEWLRRALISGGDVSGASRNLRTHNFLFLAALGSAVFKVRYGPGSGRDLSAFAGRVADACDGSGAVPAEQGKAYVRAVMDPVTADLSLLDPVAVVETQLAFYVALFREWQPTGDEAAALFAAAAGEEASLASVLQSSPQLQQLGEQMGEFLAEMEASPGGPAPEMLARAEAPGGVLAEGGVLADGGPLADLGDDFSSEDFAKVMELLLPDLQRLPASTVVQMARLLDSQGRSTEAIAAYQQVIASGEGELVAWAALCLGKLRAKMGDTASARAAFEAAIEQRHPDYTPEAAFSLGELLSQLKDISGAQQAWQLAEDSAHPRWSAVAACELGMLLAGRGQLDAARAHYQRAIESGHPDAAPRAALSLGLHLADAGDTAGAQAALRIAARSGNPQYGPVAAFRLATVLGQANDIAGARATLERAIAYDNPEWSSKAATALGMLLSSTATAVEAAAAYEQALRAGYPEGQALAARKLAVELKRTGDMDRARAYFEHAIASDHPGRAPSLLHSWASYLASRVTSTAHARPTSEQSTATRLILRWRRRWSLANCWPHRETQPTPSRCYGTPCMPVTGTLRLWLLSGSARSCRRPATSKPLRRHSSALCASDHQRSRPKPASDFGACPSLVHQGDDYVNTQVAPTR